MVSLIISLFLVLQGFNLEPEPDPVNLIVDIIQVDEERKGQIIACLSVDTNTFLEDCFLTKATKVLSDTVLLQFEELVPGSYALAVFQDLNGNGILDKNGLNLPTEPFGFSNNPRLLFGPPSHRRCSFQINDSDKHLTVKLKRIKI